jgi:hypothetical protein
MRREKPRALDTQTLAIAIGRSRDVRIGTQAALLTTGRTKSMRSIVAATP